MATLTGTTLGKYQILERLGRGGMADVYKAHHPRLDRDVAIKVLHPHLIEGEDFLARFEREAKSVASLKHPHIVQVFDFDSQDDLHYIVMELIDGGSLHGRLESLRKTGERLPREEMLHILSNIAEALDFAHRRGMLHRDVKPANVLLDHDGNAFLSDFGIARILSETRFTTTGALIGTPHYMSPEQGMGRPLTEATDLYSLGVVVYEMLTGSVPFDSDTPMGIIHKQIYEALPNPRLACPDLPAGAETLLLKALAKEPGDRFSSAGALSQALEAALGPAAAVSASPHVAAPSVAPQGIDRSMDPSLTAATAAAEPPVADERLTVSSLPTIAMEGEASPASPPAPPVQPPTRGHMAGTPRRGVRPGVIFAALAMVAVLAATFATLRPRASRPLASPPATPLPAAFLVAPTNTAPPTLTAPAPPTASPSQSVPDVFADLVVEFSPGEGANIQCDDPSAALGQPDFNADMFSTFLCLGHGGHVVLKFVNNSVVNLPGPDLYIHGDPTNEDKWHVDVSEDGSTWAHFGVQPEAVKLNLDDLEPFVLNKIQFVRLTDATSEAVGAFPGPELDAIEALHSGPP